MNPLSHVLDHPRAQGAFTLTMTMRPPWCVRIEDDSALTLLVIGNGEPWLEADGHRSQFEPGDVVLVRGYGPYRMGDALDSPLTAVIHPGQRCTTPDGVELHQSMAHGVRLWGNDPAGPDTMIVASYASVGEVGRLVTDVLPRVARLRAGVIDPALIELLAKEIGGDAPAQGTVLDRLVDILLITAIRAWVEANRPDLPGWIAGTPDPAVTVALEAIHDHPDRPWTISELAALGAVSRATLASRFTEQVGSPPIAYLTRWRLTLARDLLTDKATTLATVARSVGYGSPFALSAAFKHTFGISPSTYRRQLNGPPHPLAETPGQGSVAQTATEGVEVLHT
jgi:AraC-like DNA-binding protein